MHYYLYKQEGIKIEFLNNYAGKETIKVNGKVVSERYSIMGLDHHFETYEKGEKVSYTLRTKIGGPTMVQIDLIRNGEIILKDQSAQPGTTINRTPNILKIGIKQLRQYHLDEALETFKNGLNTDPDDGELHFYTACTYSLQENKKQAYHHLSEAITYGIDKDLIFSDDALAFIRIDKEFEQFCLNLGIKK